MVYCKVVGYLDLEIGFKWRLSILVARDPVRGI